MKMNPAMRKLHGMLMGPKKFGVADQMSMNDDPEDAAEIKAGKGFPSPREEVLEDSKGRKIGIKKSKQTSKTKVNPKLKM
jgi:hypothetical protein